MRLPYAAKTLIKQVQQTKKNAKATPTGEPDGFNVMRSIAFDKATSKWLAPRLINKDGWVDQRIEDATMDGGVLIVTFAASGIADRRDAFTLDQADLVQGD